MGSARAQEPVGPSQAHHYWVEFDYTVQSYANIADDYDADGISISEVYFSGSGVWFSPLVLGFGSIVTGTIVGAEDGGVAANTHVRLTERVYDTGTSQWVDRLTDHSLRNHLPHRVDGRQPRVASLEIHGQPANFNACNNPDNLPLSSVQAAVCDAIPGGAGSSRVLRGGDDKRAGYVQPACARDQRERAADDGERDGDC